jgi:hypothetical protein
MIIHQNAMIVDPATYDKNIAWNEAQKLVKLFFAENNIFIPEILDSSDKNVRRSSTGLKTDYGFYDGALNVNLKKSRMPVKNPGFSWSFTGSKADLTVPGILMHEVGHHLHTLAGCQYRKHHHEGCMISAFYEATNDEPVISGYEPNVFERFAEATRLFILNPLLLQEGRPRRYEFLAARYKTIHSVPWKEVLQNAHPRLISSLENWIKR